MLKGQDLTLTFGAHACCPQRAAGASGADKETNTTSRHSVSAGHHPRIVLSTLRGDWSKMNEFNCV